MEEKDKNLRLEELSVRDRMKFAEDLGKRVADTLNQATRQANKILKQYGYEVTVKAEFRILEEKEKQ